MKIAKDRITVIEENETVLDELRKLLLEFGASGSDICSAEEFIDIPAERWTESPESDDDESELAAVLHECEDPTGTGAVVLKYVSEGGKRSCSCSAAVLGREQKQRTASREIASREICAELNRMRHMQPSVAEQFRRASGSV